MEKGKRKHRRSASKVSSQSSAPRSSASRSSASKTVESHCEQAAFGKSQSPLYGACELLGNATIIAILFVAPLIMGGRHPMGKFVYVVLVGVFAMTWLVRQSLADAATYRSSGVGWLLAAAMGLVVLQLAPLPRSVIAVLSPFQQHLLPMWSDAASPISLGTWSRLSLAPGSTREGLVTLLAHITLFVVAVQWLQTWREIERLIRLVAVATIAMAAFGFVQYVSHTPKFSWIFQHPSRDASRVLSGPFANSNHFSHFLALGIGPVLWWLRESLQCRVQVFRRPLPLYGKRDSQRTDQVYLALIAGLALIATSGLLAQSRGGMLSMFIAAALGVGLFTVKGLMGSRSLMAIFATGACVAVALGIHGREEIASELSTMTSLESIDKSMSRRNIWKANLAAARRFSICGAGVGSHDEVYRRFYPQPSEVEYTHAESGYLQMLTEAGLPGLGIVLLGVGVCGRWIYILMRHVSSERIGLVVAITVPLVVSAVHSVFDFVWFIPACMSVTILIASAACRMVQITIAPASPANDDAELESEFESGIGDRLINDGVLDDDTSTEPEIRRRADHFSRPAWGAFSAAVLVMFVTIGSWQWQVAYASLAWNRYLCLALAKKVPLTIIEEASESPEQRATRIAFEHERASQRRNAMIRELETTLERYPQHPRANIRLAGIRIREFDQAQKAAENAMPLSQIRDAAYASLAVAPEKVDAWLSRALGENRTIIQDGLSKARAGVMNSPLLGRGYLYMSQVVFLEGFSAAGAEQLISQAYSVRPYDGSIWLSIGENAMLAGDVDKAFMFRKLAFHQDEECREAIIQGLAASVPVTTFLQQFEPTEVGLRSLMRFFMVHDLTDNARVVAGYLADYAIEHAKRLDGEMAASHWVRATLLYRMSGDDSVALNCAETAAETAPNSVRARRLYATELVRNGQWTTAIPELRWCLNRRPTDSAIRQMLASATRTAGAGKIDQD